MDSDKLERIRKRAYEIWQEKGSPDGAADDHWHQARREIETEVAGNGNAPATPPAPARPARKSASPRKSAGAGNSGSKKGRTLGTKAVKPADPSKS